MGVVRCLSRMRQGRSRRAQHDLTNSMNIRDIDQLAWFTSATQLLGTRYRSNVMAGLVISIGSSIASVVSCSYADRGHVLMSSLKTATKRWKGRC
jgi:hypothetical protein